MRRFQKSDAERLVKLLDQEIRSRGHGSIRAVDRAAGHEAGWWQHRAETGDIRIHEMLTVLDHLGLDPVRFLRRALGSEGRLELDRPIGGSPEIVTRAWKRFYADAEGTIGEDLLDTLDRQRYQKPTEAVNLALWAVDHVELSLLPRLLGVAGSAWRLMIQLNEAKHAIYAGIEMAERSGDVLSVGSLLLRQSSVVADQGDYAEALRVAETAAIMSLRCGDREGFGKAVVTQGIWLYNLDCPKDAIETLTISLEELPASASRNRVAALQNLGLAHQRLGNLTIAMEKLQAAQDLTPSDFLWDQAKLLWLRARIETDLGELATAASRLRKVVAVFRELHLGETALATCELVRVLLAQGRSEEAFEAATSLHGLLEPLRENKIISAAIGDLLRGGRCGLTLALVDRAMERIEDERRKGESWRSLLIGPAAS